MVDDGRQLGRAEKNIKTLKQKQIKSKKNCRPRLDFSAQRWQLEVLVFATLDSGGRQAKGAENLSKFKTKQIKKTELEISHIETSTRT
jgi:hypothetical protein